METKTQTKAQPEKKIREDSRMIIYLIDKTSENCTFDQWEESTANAYRIVKNNMEILIPHHAVVKIMFEKK